MHGKLTAIIQARLGSSRLPGKVLADIHGKPLIERMHDRVALADCLESIVYAIPGNEENAPLAEFIRSKGWNLHLDDGDENDVLGRYARAAEAFDADPVVRLTADCPLIDPGVIGGCVRLYQSGEFDFVANHIEQTFPHGIDVQVYRREALYRAHVEATEPYDREHVDPFIWNRSDRFRLGNLRCERDLSRYRLTVDYEADLALVRAVFFAYRHRLFFTTADVLRLIDANPGLYALNREHVA
jgi:spore coat polysaccharide biosynthesis protein SpsF (cytidylyltransferase family)